MLSPGYAGYRVVHTAPDAVVARPAPVQLSYRDEQLEETAPFSDLNGYGWLPIIPWGRGYYSTDDVDNLYPEQFLDLFTVDGGNPVYEAVKTGHKRMIQGGGWQIVPAGTGNEVDVARARQLLTPQLLDVCAFDLAVFDAFAVQELYDRRSLTVGGMSMVGPRRLTRLHGTRIAQVRLGSPVKTGAGIYEPDYALVAMDWSKLQVLARASIFYAWWGPGYQPEFVPFKGTTDERIGQILRDLAIDTSEQADTAYCRALHYDTAYHVASYYYPKADAESALTEMLTSHKGSVSHLAAITNGSYASQLIAWPRRGMAVELATGLPTIEERQAQQGIIEGWANMTQNAQRTGVTNFFFYDPDRGDTPPSVTSPPQDRNDTRWIAAMKSAEDKAFTAIGGVAPELWGIKTATGFAPKSETMMAAWAITEWLHTGPKRQRLQAYAQAAMDENNIQVRVTIEPPQPTFMTPTTPAL